MLRLPTLESVDGLDALLADYPDVPRRFADMLTPEWVAQASEIVF